MQYFDYLTARLRDSEARAILLFLFLCDRWPFFTFDSEMWITVSIQPGR